MDVFSEFFRRLIVLQNLLVADLMYSIILVLLIIKKQRGQLQLPSLESTY